MILEGFKSNGRLLRLLVALWLECPLSLSTVNNLLYLKKQCVHGTIAELEKKCAAIIDSILLIIESRLTSL